MKKIAQYLLLAMIAFVGVNVFSACDKADDMPPITDNNTTGNRSYRLPDPTVNTATEKQEADVITAEYEQGIK